MLDKANLSGFLGLLRKGGKILIGPSLWKSLDRVSLVLVAMGPLSNEAARLYKKLESSGKSRLDLPLTKEELGMALGLPEATYAGLTDKKAASALLKKASEAKGEL